MLSFLFLFCTVVVPFLSLVTVLSHCEQLVLLPFNAQDTVCLAICLATTVFFLNPILTSHFEQQQQQLGKELKLGNSCLLSL